MNLLWLHNSEVTCAGNREAVALERRDSLRIELNNQRLINRTTTEKR